MFSPQMLMMAAGGGLPFSIEIASHLGASSAAAARTWTSVNIGTEDAGRVVHIIYGAFTGQDDGLPSSVTINGVTATKVDHQKIDRVGGFGAQLMVGHYYALVPTGTSVSIVVNSANSEAYYGSVIVAQGTDNTNVDFEGGTVTASYTDTRTISSTGALYVIACSMEDNGAGDTFDFYSTDPDTFITNSNNLGAGYNDAPTGNASYTVGVTVDSVNDFSSIASSWK